MRVIVIILQIISFTLAINPSLFGQVQEDSSKIRLVGVGLQINTINYIDLWVEEIMTQPMNKVVLVISPIKYLRLEPGIGFSHLVEKESKLEYKRKSLAIGIFGMYQLGKTNIYGGLKIERTIISDDYVEWFSIGTRTYTCLTKRSEYGPALGAEVFLASHFTIGGEVAYNIMKLKTENYSPGYNFSRVYKSTNISLFIRFYL